MLQFQIKLCTFNTVQLKRPAQVGKWVNAWNHAFCINKVKFVSHGHETTGYGGGVPKLDLW